MEELNRNNYEQKMSEGLVIVDYFATWCNPCMSFAPIFESVASELKDKATFVKCNVDNEQRLAMSQGVASIPCIIAYKNGKEVDRFVGLRSKSDFTSFVKKQI